MGYTASPFRAKHHGFGGVLGLMNDERQACWDIYENGCCSRGLACRWQHPMSVKRLYVVVRRSVSSQDTMVEDQEDQPQSP